MFKLQDGREHLYQWDLDRYLIVEDNTIDEVHFCNRTSDCSLVVEVKDGLAAIPNIILQEARPIRVYAYIDDKYTLTEEQFTVKSRTRPADYVYTETEILQYSKLDERLTKLETNLSSTVADEVNKYMENNPVSVDLTDYYTKEETDTAIKDAVDAIDIPEVDFTGYATEKYVDDAVAAIDIPDVSTKLNKYTGTETSNYYLTGYMNKSGAGEAFFALDPVNGDFRYSASKTLVRRDTDHQIKLPNAPTADTHAVNKAYVDNALANAGGVTETKVQEMIDASLGVIENGTY